MISKAKILFYAAFRKGRPPLEAEGKKKLSILNKLLLLQVRRYKRYGEIPAYIGYYDWHQAVTRAKIHYKILALFIMLYLVQDIREFKNYMELKKSAELMKKRKEKNLPEYPLYVPFGDNSYFNYKNADHYDSLRKKIEEDPARKPSWSFTSFVLEPYKPPD